MTAAAQKADTGRMTLRVGIRAQQLLLALLLLCAWEIAGAYWGDAWTSRPSLIGAQLWRWIVGDLYVHVWATGVETLLGLCIGTATGVMVGMLLGRSRILAVILRPIVVAFYSVPMVSLAPLFIMFFGVDLLPKIILVALVVFFLSFFNTFAGVLAIDQDLIDGLVLMGGNRREQFLKVVLPGSMSWIISGVKISLPYALVAAVTGEMIAARRGIGYQISQAAAQFDMTALYANLFVLMAMALILSEIARRLENLLMRWRPADE